MAPQNAARTRQQRVEVCAVHPVVNPPSPCLYCRHRTYGYSDGTRGGRLTVQHRGMSAHNPLPLKTSLMIERNRTLGGLVLQD